MASAMLGGCATARLQQRYAGCGKPSDARKLLGLAEAPEGPEGLSESAQRNYRTAAPWVVGQGRVYPRDYGFDYAALRAEGRAPDRTPLYCEVEYRPRKRMGLMGDSVRAWASEDYFTGADLVAAYEVQDQDQGPALIVWGGKNTSSVSVLDPVHRMTDDSVLRFTVSDDDVLSRYSEVFDDAIATLEVPYPNRREFSSGMHWKGEVIARCRHLDRTAMAAAREAALDEIDAGLAGFVPYLEVESRHFGLGASGVLEMRTLATRVASLGGWRHPDLQARIDALLDVQACFEQAATDAVARHVRRQDWGRDTVDGLAWKAVHFVCAESPPAYQPWASGTCELVVEVRNADGRDSESYLRNTTLVLAGGREVDFTVETPVVVPAGETATLRLRLDPTVVASVPLTQPVLLRERVYPLLGRDTRISDVAL